MNRNRFYKEESIGIDGTGFASIAFGYPNALWGEPQSPGSRERPASYSQYLKDKVLQEQAHSGFASYTPVAFDLSRLARYDREGVEEFCRQWGLDMPKEPEKIQGKPAGRKKRERER